MYTDIYGKTRMKIGLHIHTTESDGRCSIEQAVEIYKNAGYDAIALTDHWKWHPADEINGLRILSGVEYNNKFPEGCTYMGNNSVTGVYHILGLFCESEPQIENMTDHTLFTKAIHKAGGLAVIAHPAWSLNTPGQIMALDSIDATEIYNTVSGVHASNRPYSGAVIDMLANKGCYLPLIADDDCHYYDNDCAVSYIMLDVSDGKTSDKDILNKVKTGEFYATQGPELHISRKQDGTVVATSSPVSQISFFSNAAFNKTRNTYGDGITYAEYTPLGFEKWIRAEAYDKDGKCAYTNILLLD